MNSYRVEYGKKHRVFGTEEQAYEFWNRLVRRARKHAVITYWDKSGVITLPTT